MREWQTEAERDDDLFQEGEALVAAGFDASGLISVLPVLDPPVLAWRRDVMVAGFPAELDLRGDRSVIITAGELLRLVRLQGRAGRPGGCVGIAVALVVRALYQFTRPLPPSRVETLSITIVTGLRAESQHDRNTLGDGTGASATTRSSRSNCRASSSASWRRAAFRRKGERAVLPRLKKGELVVTTREGVERLDREYWASRSMQERLAALEVLRSLTYPDPERPPGVVRVLRVTSREGR